MIFEQEDIDPKEEREIGLNRTGQTIWVKLSQTLSQINKHLLPRLLQATLIFLFSELLSTLVSNTKHNTYSCALFYHDLTVLGVFISSPLC